MRTEPGHTTGRSTQPDDRMGDGLEAKVLGPLQVSLAGRPVAIGNARKPLVLLAVLLARAGQPVPIDTLIAALWGERPPASARRNVQLYAHQLRRVLGAECLTTRGAGYAIDIGDGLDAAQFGRLAAAGSASLDAGDAGSASATLRTALELWRGPAFAEFLDCELIADEALRLELQRLETYERWAEAQLVTGATPRLVAELTELCHRHPYRESLRAHLMRALYQTGRQAEALEVFRQVRALLIDELGMEPGPSLRRVHEAILRGDDTLMPAPRHKVRAAPAVTPMPRELLPDITGWVGRADALKALDERLPDPVMNAPVPVVITVIAGPAGVGKTTLAVHWAHRHADRFPDGQLYADLRGFDETGVATSSAEVVRGFVDALQVPPQRVPAGAGAQARLYRSLLADRRVLVLLDNARDADQVRPLLPGGPGCAVVVTSRGQLPGLVATEGAHPLALDLFSPDEAHGLLAHRLGPERVAAEPSAVDEIIALCARLPLALAVAAARAATKPEFALAAVADELRQAGGTLDALAGPDPATNVRVVLSWSYRALGSAAARLFRLLALHSGPDLTAPAAASLAGAVAPQTRALLAELAHAYLVNEHVPGRYRLHDLLRAYATELTQAVDTDAARQAATHRMLDHYLHTAQGANVILYPQRDPLTLAPPQPGVTAERLAGHAEALAWFTAEHSVLLATTVRAAATGFGTHAWQLAKILWEFLDRGGRVHDQAVTENAALSAARRMADRPGQVLVHCVLARVYTRLELYDDVQVHLRYATDLADELGDPGEQARTQLVLAFVAARQGRHRNALQHAGRAHELQVAAGSVAGQAAALFAIGTYHARLGEHRRSLTRLRQALTLLQQTGDRRAEAATWDGLGSAHLQLGRLPQAIESYQRALGIYRDLGRRYEQSGVLTRLADTHLATGNHDTARETWGRALDILDHLNHPDAGVLRTKIRGVDPSDAVTGGPDSR